MLAASVFFCGWWDWRYLGLLIFTSGIDFLTAHAIEDHSPWRRAALATSRSVNLGTVFAFKYFDFFATSLHELLRALGVSGGLGSLPVLMLLGLSF